MSIKAIQPESAMLQNQYSLTGLCTVKAGLHTVNTMQPNMFTYWHTAKAVQATRFAYCKGRSAYYKISIANRFVYCKISMAQQIYVL